MLIIIKDRVAKDRLFLSPSFPLINHLLIIRNQSDDFFFSFHIYLQKMMAFCTSLPSLILAMNSSRISNLSEVKYPGCHCPSSPSNPSAPDVLGGRFTHTNFKLDWMGLDLRMMGFCRNPRLLIVVEISISVAVALIAIVGAPCLL